MIKKAQDDYDEILLKCDSLFDLCNNITQILAKVADNSKNICDIDEKINQNLSKILLKERDDNKIYLANTFQTQSEKIDLIQNQMIGIKENLVDSYSNIAKDFQMQNEKINFVYDKIDTISNEINQVKSDLKNVYDYCTYMLNEKDKKLQSKGYAQSSLDFSLSDQIGFYDKKWQHNRLALSAQYSYAFTPGRFSFVIKPGINLGLCFYRTYDDKNSVGVSYDLINISFGIRYNFYDNLRIDFMPTGIVYGICKNAYVYFKSDVSVRYKNIILGADYSYYLSRSYDDECYSIFGDAFTLFAGYSFDIKK